MTRGNKGMHQKMVRILREVKKKDSSSLTHKKNGRAIFFLVCGDGVEEVDFTWNSSIKIR